MKNLFLSIVSALLTLSMSAQVPSTMKTEANSKVVEQKELSADFIVCGGGLSGVCAAVSAARHGASVILVQDRPVLGGNASSEMRMGIVGVHHSKDMETGILEELQCKNFYYNPLQRYTLWDDVILSTVVNEPGITLLLNTTVNDVVMDGDRIAAVKVWNINAYTHYTISGRIFADCTGDGILRLSGAKFRRGRELPSEFGETYLQQGGDSRTMGNSILLQLRRTDEDHPFRAPEWAYHFTDSDFNYPTPKSTIPGVRFNYKRLYPEDNNFWWIEFGGNFDTIFDANDIQLELKKIAYGVWEYMKNNPDGRCKGYDLDWIGSLPGKRESTRYVGPHILTQNDVLGGGHFEDVVAYGGWTLDDHDPDAFHKKGRISVEYSTPDIFGIPYDCLYSVNVPNLMFAGRDISCTHMGLSASRVMSTCALLGQAVGTAASIALKKGELPADVRRNDIALLQDTLEDDDCMLPYRWRKVSQLTLVAKISAPAGPTSPDVLKNGIDRIYDNEGNGVNVDNGVWLSSGESIEYSWKRPVTVSAVRLIFDSDLKVRGKRMRKLEATTERKAMPAPMVRTFHIEALVKGKWETVYSDGENFLRLRKLVLATPVETKALRLVIDSVWGESDAVPSRAHVFAFDVL